MSLFDDASLVLIPDGAKDGTLYSVKPTDGTGDFTFTRGSNLAATRVDENGLIEKGRENLLTYSNTFTSWGNIGGTIVGGQSGYDGSSNAYLFTLTSSANICSQTNTQSGLQTFSVHAKGSVNNGLRLYAFGSNNCYAYFDLNLGTVETTVNIIDATIEDKGNGWYRCAMTFNQTNTDVYMYMSNNQNQNASSGSIYIQDAQLEAGLVATDYIETGATTAQAGILEDLPRIDYSGGASCPALLLEPQRTNSVNHSELFSVSGGYWGNTRGSVESNSTTSPEGVVNASKLLQDPAESNSGLVNRTITASGSNTFSFYAKKGTKNFARLGLYSSVETSVYFDLENGTIGTTNLIAEADCFIEDMGNDWYRCGATYSGATNRFNIYIADRDGETTLLDSTDAYIYIYGAQWEASASYPTSYIPTYGTSVTRGEDDCRKTGISSLIGQTEGTLYAEFDIASNTEDGDIIAVNNGFSSDGFFVSYRGSNVVQLIVRTSSSNALIFQRTGVYPIGKNKIAVSYKNGDFAISLNGTATQVNTSTITMPSSISDLRLFGGQLYTQTLPIQYAQAALFKTRLSNADCEILTGGGYESFAAMATALNYTRYE